MTEISHLSKKRHWYKCWMLKLAYLRKVDMGLKKKRQKVKKHTLVSEEFSRNDLATRAEKFRRCHHNFFF